MDVNYALYKEIWDHKDMGFYLLTTFLQGTWYPGLFFSTLLIIILFYFSLNYYLKKKIFLKITILFHFNNFFYCIY